jgi:DNA-binding transcriptional LysR family regulator
MLDVRRLRVLREVARHGSLSAAAAALGYTQPAVSRQISVLESEVGMKLLRRLPQGVALTDAGRLLVERTDEVLLSLSRTEEELRARGNLEGGTLRMAVFASAAASVAPQALARFRERHPGIELIVTVADPVDSLPLVRSGELDLALCNGIDPVNPEPVSRRAPEPGGLRLEHVHLFDDPMYVALPAGHPLAHEPELPLRMLADESWMLATKDSCPDAELFFGTCEAEGIEPCVGFQYDDYAALLGFVAAGVGISVIPDMVARVARDDVVIRTPDPPLPPRRISAAIPTGYRSPAVSAKLQTLLELAPDWVAGQVDSSGGAQPARLDPALAR